jgi:hypothetical protein
VAIRNHIGVIASVNLVCKNGSSSLVSGRLPAECQGPFMAEPGPMPSG